MRDSEKKKVEKKLKKLACECLYGLLDDPTKRVVIGFALPYRVRVTRRKNRTGITVTVDKPNYEERQYIALCKKAKTRPRKFWLKFFKEAC